MQQVLVPDTYQPANSPAANTQSAHKTEGAMRKDAPKRSKSATTKAAASREKRGGSMGGRRGWAEAEEQAKAGKMPPCPDFSAPTHNSYRKKLEEVHAMAKARDLKALQKFDLPRKDSSRSAIMRYRDLCIVTIQATGKKKAA